MLLSGTAAGIYIINSSIRVQQILQNGIGEDLSGAVRMLRINSFIGGALKNPFMMLLGYGLGNLGVPFRKGFNQAFSNYKGLITAEVQSLMECKTIDSLFCMPMKIIGEFGFIVLLFIIVYIVYLSKLKKIDGFVLIMTAWIYIQFDSYAFYAIWIIVFMCRYYTKDKFGESYFKLFK